MNSDSEHQLQLGKWIGGAALGALVMYMLDPERGAARRALSAAKLRQLSRRTGAALDQAGHEIEAGMDSAGSGVRRLAGEAMSALKDSRERAAEVLAPLSRAAPWPAAPGYASGRDDLPAMAGPQGEARPWGAGMRGAALAGGGALGLYGLITQRSPLAMLAGMAGMLLLARSAANQPLRSLVPASAQARPVEVEKSVRIDASPEQVFDLFANYENFPRFLSNVLEVRDLGERRSHWVVKGPAGSHYAWNAVLTEHSRPDRLAWQSEAGAEVENYGSIHFEPVGRGGTRVTVRMSYKPPAGVVGRAIASVFGSEPGQQMDKDLYRMKALVERGDMAASARPASSDSGFLH